MGDRGRVYVTINQLLILISLVCWTLILELTWTRTLSYFPLVLALFTKQGQVLQCVYVVVKFQFHLNFNFN